MFIAKNSDRIVMTAETREELLQRLTFMVYDTIEETETEYILHNGSYVTQAEIAQQREEDFNKEFFLTSSGYIRRKVSMSTGETKDFLSDLLPSISMGVQLGHPVSIIGYNKPDFTQDTIDWESLQKPIVASAQFVQECFAQLSNDFLPMETDTDSETETETDTDL